MDLVVVGVPLCDWIGGSSLVGIVVCNVGGKTTNTIRLVGASEDLPEESGSGTDVCRPSEPPSVTSIEVQEQVCRRGWSVMMIGLEL